jgi:hypothetical protein
MNKTDALLEQRRHKRFRPQDGTYAILRGPGKKLGQVINISRGGLAFRYIDIGERPERSFELDISIEEYGFILDNLSFETLSDFSTSREFPFSSTPIRRRCGQFKALNKNQLSELEYLIQNYAIGEA